jgi:hypothetical protein
MGAAHPQDSPLRRYWFDFAQTLPYRWPCRYVRTTLLPMSALSLQMRWTMLLERGLQNTSVTINAAFLPSMAIDNLSFATLSAAIHVSKCRELFIYY